MSRFPYWLVTSLILGGCQTVSESDKYGYRWYQEKEPCTSLNIIESASTYIMCDPNYIACTVRRGRSCVVYLPPNAHPDLLEHERRHVNGENHSR